MLKNTRPYLILVLAIVFAGPVLADSDPTLSQVYEAARTGHLAQAQQMMDQVLRDHPNSAKAHYVAAELYARAGNSSMARQELNTAERLQPGLPFAKPDSVRALQRELSRAQPLHALPAHSQARSSFPWGTVVVVVAGVGVLWLILRRRSSPGTGYSQYPGGVPTPGAPGNPGGAGVAPNVGAGMGSGIAGGLASGLAVGAGVVAGEELAHHFLDSNRPEGAVPPAANEPVENPANNDLGGPDFGVSDGSSWDDDGGAIGGDGSGDDWT
jgi:hypothetical protein